MNKNIHLATTSVNNKEPNTTINIKIDTIKALNQYCRENAKIRVYVLDKIIQDFIKTETEKNKS